MLHCAMCPLRLSCSRCHAPCLQDYPLQPLVDDCRLLGSLLDDCLRIEVGDELFHKVRYLLRAPVGGTASAAAAHLSGQQPLSAPQHACSGGVHGPTAAAGAAGIQRKAAAAACCSQRSVAGSTAPASC